MTDEEQKAFVEAYNNNVAELNPEYVAKFVKRWADHEELDYGHEESHLVDAMLMWNAAINWHIKTLSEG